VQGVGQLENEELIDLIRVAIGEARRRGIGSVSATSELVPKNWTDGLALDLISNPRERIRRR
jgi:hypothetical protein